jgi:hypothetical protein
LDRPISILLRVGYKIETRDGDIDMDLTHWTTEELRVGIWDDGVKVVIYV